MGITIKAQVYAAYGGKCTWCSSTIGLELDHIHGDGNKHRAEIKTKLHTWLYRQHQETGRWYPHVQLLCRYHHTKKSGRIKMPAKKGHTNVNVAIEDTLLSSLSVLAAQPDFEGSKSKVVDAALRAFVETTANMQTIDNFHQHLSVVSANLTEAMQGPIPYLAELAKIVHRMETQLTNLQQQLAGFIQQSDRKHGELVRAYDGLREQMQTGKPTRTGIWRGITS